MSRIGGADAGTDGFVKSNPGLEGDAVHQA